ncbi:hypothetical protein HHL16_13415 [Pseudoflavitalea sp. G-6-1-2]|uniref:hypothetical protein n=1 Tax=Pseudoflavitalea sp. G-6-1-2 TaxID=2728841 RepID=UPI00146A08AD|nr:hypothetical protein [Pseudoflavitalea sp. G-6-1-2]NML21883.1 hypothetical protein [Pseudoflavitalea sp. G-6-1-2]
MTEKKVKSYLDKLKEKAAAQENYGGSLEASEAKMDAVDCPNCGAGRAKQDGVTHCAYCGFEFIAVKLSNGINIQSTDNSRQA